MAMTGRILGRVRRLERAVARAAFTVAQQSTEVPCTECGGGSTRGAAPGSPQWCVVFGSDACDRPRHCPACGRQQVFEVRFDSDG